MAVPSANFTEATHASVAPPWMLRLRALFSRISIQRCERTLQVCETLSLGDRRYLAIVRCGEQRLLIGMTSQNISLLDRLPDAVSPNSAPAGELPANQMGNLR